MPAVMRAAKRRGLRGRRSARAVRGPNDRLDRSRPRLHPQPRHSRRLHLPHRGLHGGGVEPRHTTADGSAALRADSLVRLRGTRGVRRVLSPTTSSSTTQRSSTATARQARALRDPLCAVGRPRLRRAGATGTRMSKTACSARPTTRCGVQRFARAPTSSRSRRTTSGAKGHRSSPPGTVGGTRATTAPTGCTARCRRRAYVTRTAYWTSRF